MASEHGMGPGVACQVCPLSLSIITATPSLSEKVMVKIDTFVGYNDNKRRNIYIDFYCDKEGSAH
jgi:hypothetical protein